MRSPIPARLRGRRPSPALVVSIISLVMATAGTATAARVLITSSSQIKANAVTGSDVKDASIAGRDLKANAVTGDKVRNGSIAIDDLESPARQALSGGTGAEAIEAFRKDGPQNQEPGKVVRIATLSNIPPGTYAIFAKTVLTPQDPAAGSLFGQGKTIAGHCVLDAGGDKDEGRVLLSTPGSLAPGLLNVQITRSYGSTGTATLDCDTTEARFNATDTSIIALRVGKAPRSPVEG
jgi:hypothetical protein